MNYVKPFWGFIRAVLMGQARHFIGIGGGYLIAHGMAAGYSQDQLLGAGMCAASVLLSVVDKLVVDKQEASAINTPPPATPATTVLGGSAPPVTMKPISN
jgi:hypothetical protein